MVDKSDHILITGATGFIGSYICRYLLHRGHNNIHALHRGSSSFELLGEDREKITWHECDMLDMISLDKIISQSISVIIHAAAIVSFSPKDDEAMLDTNTRGTRFLVNAALTHNIKRFIHISSVAALGKTTSGKKIDEDSEWVESKNNSPYSISKKEAEMEVWRAHAEGLPVVILNPSIVLGAGFWDKSSVKIFGNMIRGQKLYPAGSNGFVDVRDVAYATFSCLTTNHIGNRYVISGINISFRALMEKIAQVYKVKPPSFEIRSWMIPIAWRLLSFISLVARKATVFNKYSVISSSKKWSYDNSKSITDLELSYTDFDKTITDTAECFLKTRNNKYGILTFK